MFACLSVRPSLPLVRFVQLLRNADQRIVNIMKVFIERNTLKVELIRCRKHMFDCIHVYFCEAFDLIQYRPPNANPEVLNTTHFGSVSDNVRELGLKLGLR